MSDRDLILRTRFVGRATFLQSLLDLWKYRHLCLRLASADIESRFRRSALGVIWAMIHPLAFTVLYSIVLSQLFKQEFKDYSVYVFSGLVLWNAIAGYINSGSNALINAGGYLKQAPIPLLLFPIRVSLTTTFVFFIECASLVAYAAIMATFFGSSVVLSINWLWVFPVGAALFVFGIPLASFTSFLNAKFRDTQQFLLIATQAVWFASPIFFSRELFETPTLRLWSQINPVAAFCDVFREPVLFGRLPSIEPMITLGVWLVILWAVALLTLRLFSRRVVMHL